MIVSVLQENLLRALSRTSRILSARPQLPVLSMALIEAGPGRLTITTTNMETTEIVSVAAKTEKEGSTCVSSRLLTELISSLRPDTVTLSVEDGALLVSSGRTRATIPGAPSSEFPPVAVQEGKGTPIEKKEISAALSRVLFAAAIDDSRPLLTGVVLKKQKDDLVIAATDGYRLSVSTVGLSFSEDDNLVVPARALAEVVKVGNEEKDADTLAFSKTADGQLLFTIGNTQIITRLITGDYPAFEKIIPKAHTTSLTIEAEALLRAVKTAAIFARDNANIIKIHVEKDKIVVSANTPMVGEDSVELDAEVEGEGGDIAFNCRFFLEFLNNFTGDQLTFEMTGSLNPGVFRPVGDASHFHVIMPVRVQG